MCEVRYLLSTGEFTIHEAAPLRPRSDPHCLLAGACFPKDNHFGSFGLTIFITGSPRLIHGAGGAWGKRAQVCASAARPRGERDLLSLMVVFRRLEAGSWVQFERVAESSERWASHARHTSGDRKSTRLNSSH